MNYLISTPGATLWRSATPDGYREAFWRASTSRETRTSFGENLRFRCALPNALAPVDAMGAFDYYTSPKMAMKPIPRACTKNHFWRGLLTEQPKSVW